MRTTEQIVEPIALPEGTPRSDLRFALLAIARAVSDAAAIAAAGLGAYVLRFEHHWLVITGDAANVLGRYLVLTAGWVVLALAALAWNRMYGEDTLFAGGGELVRAGRALLEALAVGSILVFVVRDVEVSRGWLALTTMGSLVALTTTRLLMRWAIGHVRHRGALRRAAILLSEGNGSDPDWFPSHPDEFEVAASVDLEGFPDLVERVRARGAGRPAVIVRGEDYDERRLWTIVAVAGTAGWPVYVWSSLPSVGRDRLGTRGIGGRTVLRVSPPSIRGLRAVQKRSLDVAGSCFGLVLLGIPLAIGALAIAVSSGRPVFYGQERVGRDGRAFRMWKLRTMRVGSDADGQGWTTEEDDRRTKVGVVLRRFSLDELPQLWNVLKGDMSLVGPRPEQPFFAGRFEEELERYGFRQRIRPGLTGWAQAHGLRGDTSLDARVEFDNWYIEHWSLALDLKIVAQTAVEVVRGRSH